MGSQSCDSMGKDPQENTYFTRLPNKLSQPYSQQAVVQYLKLIRAQTNFCTHDELIPYVVL